MHQALEDLGEREMRAILKQLAILILGLLPAAAVQGADQTPDYSKQVAPILKKYCAGCHNEQDREGKLSLESFASLQRGGKSGSALLPGDGAFSFWAFAFCSK